MQACTLRKERWSSHQTETSVKATTLAERVDLNSSAVSPKIQPVVLRILMTLPSTCWAHTLCSLLQRPEHVGELEQSAALLCKVLVAAPRSGTQV